MSKLGTYKYIDDEKLKRKFEVTNILENQNILDNYYKNTLRDFSPDTPTFAYEESRKNYDSVGKLNTHYYGRRNDKEPFQPDLFLGFTDKDPRSIHDGPLMGKYQEQIWKRKDDLKYSFKDDSDNSVPTTGISETKMQKNKKMSYKGFQDRYKNYEESTDAWALGFKPVKSDMSKVYLHDVDDTIPDLSKIKDLGNRRDVINEMSKRSLPNGWTSTPDQKFKIAKYTKLLSQMSIKDINILKNKNQQEKDSKDNTLDSEQQLLKQLILLTQNYRNKKQSDFANQDITYKISKTDQSRSVNKNKEYFKNQEILNTEMDDKKISLADEINSKIFSNKEYNNLNEILRKSLMSIKKTELDKGNNKEVSNQKQKLKNDIISEIQMQSIKSNNETFINKGNNKESGNKKSGISMLSNNNSEFIYHNNEVNKDTIQSNNNDYTIINYSTLAPQFVNNYESTQQSIETQLQNVNNEKDNQHRKPNNQSNDALHQDNFENDMEFNESGFKLKKNGIYGSKYTARDIKYENSMGDTTINDISGFNNKRRMVI